MYIKRIDIQNFKLFDRRSFDFHPRFNLVVGVNGSGKTSLLKAVAAGLSEMMKHVSDNFPILEDDVRNMLASIGPQFRFEKKYPATISLVISGFGDDSDAYIKAEKKSQADNGESKVWPKEWNDLIKRQVNKLDQGKWATLPVVAFYRCNRLWQSETSPFALMVAATHKDSRLDAYDSWFDASVDYSAFQSWIIGKTLERLQHTQETGESFDRLDDYPDFESDELALVNEAISSCLEDGRRIFYHLSQRTLLVEWKTPDIKPFDLLSDGQRILVAMVADIARRACLLNPHLGNRVLEETPGIVLIDELDLHLHPRWQRRVIADLRRTFPQIQFICTTHSPQLIGECKPEEIILLDAPETEHPGQSYGMDSNWILRHVMGSDDRDPRIAEKLDAIFEAIEEAEFEKAETAISELRGEIGEHPDLVEAEALIGRYTRHSGDGEE